MGPLYLTIVASIVRTQPTKRLALAVGTSRDDITDLDGAVGSDHAIDQQFEQRPLLVEAGTCQAVAHTAAEYLGVGCQAGRLTLAFGIVGEFGLLPVQRLQPCLGVAQRPVPDQVGFGNWQGEEVRELRLSERASSRHGGLSRLE